MTFTLVDGSITTAGRRQKDPKGAPGSKFLVTIGTCATSGGIQALRNFTDVKDFIRRSMPTPNTSRP